MRPEKEDKFAHISRRSVLKTSLAATALNIVVRTSEGRRSERKKMRIKQSVCRWCYKEHR